MSEQSVKVEKPAGAEYSLDVNQIMGRLPHRYPFLMIDKVTQVKLGESAVGIKNVTINEPFFAGHFPGRPVMPGVLMIEAMAQTAGVLVMETLGVGPASNMIVYFMTIDDCRFRRPVAPGDCLELHVQKQRHRGPVWKFAGQAKVGGVTVAEATYSAMIVED